MVQAVYGYKWQWWYRQWLGVDDSDGKSSDWVWLDIDAINGIIMQWLGGYGSAGIGSDWV